MPKRKLSDLADRPASRLSPSPQDAALYLQTTRLTQKFEFGVIALSRALKNARVFERQKLGRREKAAKSEGKEETLKRIEEEIKVVKTLDPTATAVKYLFKQLAKTKRIAEAPAFVKFQEGKRISVEGPRSTAEANVTARLYKSNPVQNVFPGVMDGIRSLLGVEAPSTSKGQDVKKKTKDSKKDNATSEKPVPQRKAPSNKSDEELEPEAEPEHAADLARHDVDMDDLESMGDGEEDYAQFDARLASDSEDDDDDNNDNNNHSDSSIALAANSNARPRRSMSISLSPSPELSDSPPSKKQKSKPSAQKASSAPATSTTFLPSLTMGGYWSGSESEAEDIDHVEKPAQRKNRMGQQARRALWEKKYGSGANHLKQQKTKGRNSRDNGWDARKGATGDGDRARGGRFGAGRGGPVGTGSNLVQRRDNTQRGGFGGADKKPQDDKPLHPSWEAARKAKEQKSTTSFSGKKVVFD
ncbi:hypothetical protein ARAM_001083 [Aspergillus rambellii]|uniref:Bud22 domain-containing protein n=1 Tax=Aspergillus rambellii TaxID=308745 RepID=A0A0F8WI49_9EURO|nr:hypothetical protein ARAM_001083 [Aspergillus rambellii]